MTNLFMAFRMGKHTRPFATHTIVLIYFGDIHFRVFRVENDSPFCDTRNNCYFISCVRLMMIVIQMCHVVVCEQPDAATVTCTSKYLTTTFSFFLENTPNGCFFK